MRKGNVSSSDSNNQSSVEDNGRFSQLSPIVENEEEKEPLNEDFTKKFRKTGLG